jgi:orotate phosphoribosyltransferase
VAIVDDLLNSGRSVTKGIDVLRTEGFDVLTALVLLEIGWGRGPAELQRRGVSTWPLATLQRESKGPLSPPKANSHQGS